MTDLNVLLDSYPALSAEERAHVDARVAGRPEFAAAHDEARRLAAFADALEAALDPARESDPAFRAVADRLGDSVVEGAAANAEERARADARLDVLAEAAEDPIARFERLTDHALDAIDRQRPGRAADRPPAAGGRRLRLWPARWVAASAALLVAYGGLFAASSMTVTERAQVAALDEVEAIPTPVLRGTKAPPVADRLTPALDAVAAARRSTLGLFPTYDAAALAVVAADADPRSTASQEARLALGRVRLYQGRDVEAARELGGLVAQGSYRAAAARRLLDYIRAQE